MTLIGIMLARNESWILGLSLRVALKWCDQVVILDHNSTDYTGEVIHRVRHEVESGRIHVIRQLEDEWDEMRHRQTALELARKLGGTHIAIIDADEVMTADALPLIRSAIEALPEGRMLSAPGYNLRIPRNVGHGEDMDAETRYNSFSSVEYHTSHVWGNRWFSLAWKDNPDFNWSGRQFHRREPWYSGGQGMQGSLFSDQGGPGILHFWGANEFRLHEKHRMYRIRERLMFPERNVAVIEKMYSQAERGTPGSGDVPRNWTYAPLPEAWVKPYNEAISAYLDLWRPPWQTAWIEEQIKTHGLAHSEGLSI